MTLLFKVKKYILDQLKLVKSVKSQTKNLFVMKTKSTVNLRPRKRLVGCYICQTRYMPL